MGSGDPSMPTINPSGWKTLPDEKRVSPGRVAPTVAFAGYSLRLNIYSLLLQSQKFYISNQEQR